MTPGSILRYRLSFIDGHIVQCFVPSSLSFEFSLVFLATFALCFLADFQILLMVFSLCIHLGAKN